MILCHPCRLSFLHQNINIINFDPTTFILKFVLLQLLPIALEDYTAMYQDQAQEGAGQLTEKCELCLKQVSADMTYAGVFHRICKACYQSQIDDLEEPIHFIGEGIFIGNERASRNENLLKQHKIGAICICGSDLKVYDYEHLKPEKKVVKILDTATQNLIDFLPDTIQWLLTMNKKKINVLVHCAGGVSRSASICMAFFMKKDRMAFQDSYLLVKRARKCVKPNQNFVKQLKNYEKSINA